ncbi:serine/threonine protein kinase [Streptomyces sp. NPDC021225]|uniref:serine/threonine protein kinase n=1 Tax=Streptomyces sp. NPDC021225 TaxID=3365121 RepID=UPI0037AE1672
MTGYHGGIEGLAPGARVGPYRILSVLAGGGMGRVYLARSPGGRLVALKTIREEGPISDAARQRFAREVRLARRVSGIYTANVMDADPDADVPWMATEYIAAPSLAHLVETCGPLPVPAVWWVGAGIAEALVNVHAAGLVHRDVKPSNVLLPEGGPRVIDFGISHAVDVTRTTATLGTIAFTSPEQARGEESSPASDVFSLGATMFCLAVGRPPYAETGEVLQLLGRVAQGRLDLTGLPAELDGPVRGCLAADPADRPSPRELLEVLAAELDAPATASDDTAWLPPNWLRAIDAFRERGSASAQEPGRESGPQSGTPAGSWGLVERGETAWPAEAAVLQDARTAPVPPPPPTRHHTVLTGPPRRASGPGRRKIVAAVAAIVVVLAVVLAALMFNNFNNSDNSDNGGEPKARASGSTSASPGSASPTSTADTAAEPALLTGECTDVFHDGSAWYPADKVPGRVDCAADDAYYKVVDRAEQREGMDCSQTWQIEWKPAEADRPALCMERLYRVGQCFPLHTDSWGEEIVEARVGARTPCGWQIPFTGRDWLKARIFKVLEGQDKVYADACGDDFGTYMVIVKPRELALCARET